MTFELTYFWFNLLEGIFWIFLAGLCFYTVRKYQVTDFKRLAQFTGLTLFLFGVSDFVEIYTDGFIGHDEWLFVWKALCVLCLVTSVVWYLRIRTRRGEWNE